MNRNKSAACAAEDKYPAADNPQGDVIRVLHTWTFLKFVANTRDPSTFLLLFDMHAETGT